MRLKFKILSFFLFFSFASGFAQKNTGWSPIGLTASGKNIQNGVEAFYQISKCDHKDVILIKLVNQNEFAVNVEWNDAIFTKEQQWIRNEKADVKKCLTINGGETKTGECSEKSPKELIVIVHDFIKDIDEFNLFRITNLNITSIIK